jgi:predicted lipoprotein with Yx(FWY)xxD motif
MFASAKQQPARSLRQMGRSSAATAAAAATLALAASLAAIALAASASVTINSASSSKLGERVAVNPQGLTLYSLSPETASHLLCKSRECLAFWPPVTVPSRKTKLKAGRNVQGRLGILRRSNGTLQVTLRGMPLYRFVKDRAKGEANGQGIESFGGTWHAVSASTGAPPAPQPPMSPPPSSPPGYGGSPPPSSPPGYGGSPPPSSPPGYGY